METKKAIRSQILKNRRMLSAQEQQIKSHQIAEKIAVHPFFLEADVIFVYADYNNEVQTKEIVDIAHELGKQVAMPRVLGDEMEFFGVVSYDNLEPGCMGIPEPKKSCPSMRMLSNEVKVLVIMPGAVFDKNRHRIGYGGGFYDKYLSAHPKYVTIAVGYDLQIMEQIPSESFDIKPEVIITESSIYE